MGEGLPLLAACEPSGSRKKGGSVLASAHGRGDREQRVAARATEILEQESRTKAETCPLSTKSQSFNFGTRLLARKRSTSSLPNRRRSSLVPYHPVAVASNGPQSLHRRKIPATNPPRTLPSARTRPADDLVLPFWQQNWFLLLLFLMALSLFVLAIFLYFSLQLEEGAPIPTSAVASEGVAISYGTVLKLMHERTKFRLHSHEVPYGSGSGQQSVTGFPNVDDSNSYWIVRPIPDSSSKQGDAIPHGTIIRLQHMRTQKWLHSHLHASPISGNLEVSCFGGDGQSDTGDLWRLEIEGNGKIWKQDQRIRLKHVDTLGYLHSHDKKYTRIAGGQQEVCGIREKKPDNIWLAAEGVYLPVHGS
ncbi:hypothetical protein M5K25_021609 [Dendrobium thyrsiflorum]|uniref:MIR domain-containing protein n=1 Tax=Dendrobium thyrsiflorum TaxID=117978 RepID=A0ABD0UDM4_DENTH